MKIAGFMTKNTYHCKYILKYPLDEEHTDVKMLEGLL